MINQILRCSLICVILCSTAILHAQGEPKPTTQQLLSPDWMEQELKKVGIDQLIENYKGHQQKEIKLLHSALLLSQFVLREHPEALRSQLQGRLVSHPFPLLKPFQQLPKDQVQIYAMTGGVVQAGGSIVRTIVENDNPLVFGDELTKAFLLKDKSQMITTTQPGLVKIWNIDQGKVLRTFQVNKGSWAYEFSPDEKTLITQGIETTIPGQPSPVGGHKNIMHVWDVASGKLRYSSTLTKGHFLKYVISPDNTICIIRIRGHPLTCWDVKTGKKLYAFPGIKDSLSITSIAFYPDGKRLLLANGKKFSSYNLETGQFLSEIIPTRRLSSQPFLTAITTDSKYALSVRVGGTNGSGYFYDLLNLKTGVNRAYPKGYLPHYTIKLMTFSVNKKEIVARYAGKTKIVWDIETGKMLQPYPGLPSNFEPISISRDGTRMLAGRLGSTLRVCDINPSAKTSLPTGKRSTIYSILISADEKKFISTGSSKLINQWDFKTMKLFKSFGKHPRRILATAISKDEKQIVTSSLDNTVRLWDLNQEKLLKSFKGQYQGDVNFSVVMTPDGKEIISATGGSYMAVWNVETGVMKKVGKIDGEARRGKSRWASSSVSKVILSPEGKSFVTGGGGHFIKEWDRKTLKLLSQSTRHQSTVDCLAISPDGKILMSGSDNGFILITKGYRNSPNGAHVEMSTYYQFHKSRICLLKFLCGGKFVLSGSKIGSPLKHSDSSLRIWNPRTNKLLATFHLDSQIQSATLSPSEKYILIGTYAGELHKFRIDNLPK